MLTSLDIKIEFLKRGITCGKIARQLGVTRAAVVLVVNRKMVSARIRKAIADALELPFFEVWGTEEKVA